MSRYTIRRIAGVALHHPQHLSVVCTEPGIGELCRTQTEAKARRVQQALDVLERFERGELVERALAAAASD
jgi:hypothetical protein